MGRDLLSGRRDEGDGLRSTGSNSYDPAVVNDQNQNQSAAADEQRQSQLDSIVDNVIVILQVNWLLQVSILSGISAKSSASTREVSNFAESECSNET